MTSLFSYLLTFLGVIFWVFRAITTVLYQLDVDFFATPINVNFEIFILFATLPCILLVIRRNIIGAAMYLALYVTYFGTALYEVIIGMQSGGVTIVNTSNLFCVVLGIIIPVLTFFDILLNKNRKGFSGNKKTDWYYNNAKYDREMDERADRNQYKI